MLIQEPDPHTGKNTKPELISALKATTAMSPDALAVAEPDHGHLSYKQLDRLTDQLAAQICEARLLPGEIAAVRGKRCIQSFVLMVAIQKAGGIYMPIDTSLPESRIKVMLQSAQCRLIFDGHGAALNQLPPFTCSPSDQPTTRLDHQDLATLIFTSGSTGQPKGALNTDIGLANMAQACAHAWGLQKSDRALQFVSIGFDVSIEEIWSAWTVGAAVIIPPDKVRTSVGALTRFIESHKITLTHLPVAYWHEWVEELSKARVTVPKSLRLVIIGGEQPGLAAYEKWRSATGGRVRLAVEYGLTETSVTSTIYRDWLDAAPGTDGIPVGKAIDGVTIQIKDPNQASVRDGEPGEIWIRGKGVGAGYLNFPDETTKQFIKGSFRTGDTGYIDESGQLHFIGRCDRQVKILGHRIELDDIEATLQLITGVVECAVIIQSDPDRIHAFVTGAADVDTAMIRSQLIIDLPPAMVPSTITRLESLPKSPNGKIDYQQLSAPDETEVIDTDMDTESYVSRVIRNVAAQTLAIRKPSLRSSFTSLGGDSLSATKMCSELNAFGLRLEAHEILMAENLSDIAKFAEATTEGNSPLVHLSGSGDATPVFLFHATPGDLLGYRYLAPLIGRNRPCYGFISPDLKNDSGFMQSIEEMASRYADELLASGIPGPYVLAGWCFGGIIAFETALQLSARGKQVAFLGLIETPSPGVLASRRLRIFLKLRYLTLRAPFLIADRIRRFFQRPKPDELETDESVTNDALYQTNLRVALTYPKKIYPGHADLFFSSDECMSDPGDLFGWRHSPCAESYQHTAVPGNHTSMLKPPGAEMIADLIEAGIANGLKRMHE
jgi:amino acid adenylation domain-containing protein